MTQDTDKVSARQVWKKNRHHITQVSILWQVGQRTEQE